MSFIKSFALAIFLTLLVAEPVYSAQIQIIDGRFEGEKYVRISGEIVKGDLSKVKATLKSVSSESSNPIKILLNSEGGDVDEAILIGELLRSLMAETLVYGNDFYNPRTKDGQEMARMAESYQQIRFNLVPILANGQIPDDKVVKCYSACVLIFYGGASHYVSDNIALKGKGQTSMPVMGLHRPYFSSKEYAALSPDKASSTYSVLEDRVRSYMRKMGAPNEVVDRMLRKSSNQIDLVADKEFEKYYQQTEPFLDEWQIARCKAFGPSNALTPDEYEAYRQYQNSFELAIKQGKLKSAEQIDTYVPTGQSGDRIRYLKSKINEYNSSAMSCRTRAIRKFQSEKLASL